MSNAGEADFDLYEDLEDPFFPVRAGSCSEETSPPPSSSSTVSVRKEELEALKDQNSVLASQNLALKKNISCLFKTARLEIDRKDSTIQELKNRIEALENMFKESVPRDYAEAGFLEEYEASLVQQFFKAMISHQSIEGDPSAAGEWDTHHKQRRSKRSSRSVKNGSSSHTSRGRSSSAEQSRNLQSAEAANESSYIPPTSNTALDSSLMKKCSASAPRQTDASNRQCSSPAVSVPVKKSRHEECTSRHDGELRTKDDSKTPERIKTPGHLKTSRHEGGSSRHELGKKGDPPDRIKTPGRLKTSRHEEGAKKEDLKTPDQLKSSSGSDLRHKLQSRRRSSGGHEGSRVSHPSRASERDSLKSRRDLSPRKHRRSLRGDSRDRLERSPLHRSTRSRDDRRRGRSSSVERRHSSSHHHSRGGDSGSKILSKSCVRLGQGAHSRDGSSRSSERAGSGELSPCMEVASDHGRDAQEETFSVASNLTLGSLDDVCAQLNVEYEFDELTTASGDLEDLEEGEICSNAGSSDSMDLAESVNNGSAPSHVDNVDNASADAFSLADTDSRSEGDTDSKSEGDTDSRSGDMDSEQVSSHRMSTPVFDPELASDPSRDQPPTLSPSRSCELVERDTLCSASPLHQPAEEEQHLQSIERLDQSSPSESDPVSIFQEEVKHRSLSLESTLREGALALQHLSVSPEFSPHSSLFQPCQEGAPLLQHRSVSPETPFTCQEGLQHQSVSPEVTPHPSLFQPCQEGSPFSQHQSVSPDVSPHSSLFQPCQPLLQHRSISPEVPSIYQSVSPEVPSTYQSASPEVSPHSSLFQPFQEGGPLLRHQSVSPETPSICQEGAQYQSVSPDVSPHSSLFQPCQEEAFHLQHQSVSPHPSLCQQGAFQLQYQNISSPHPPIFQEGAPLCQHRSVSPEISPHSSLFQPCQPLLQHRSVSPEVSPHSSLFQPFQEGAPLSISPDVSPHPSLFQLGQEGTPFLQHQGLSAGTTPHPPQEGSPDLLQHVSASPGQEGAPMLQSQGISQQHWEEVQGICDPCVPQPELGTPVYHTTSPTTSPPIDPLSSHVPGPSSWQASHILPCSNAQSHPQFPTKEPEMLPTPLIPGAQTLNHVSSPSAHSGEALGDTKSPDPLPRSLAYDHLGELLTLNLPEPQEVSHTASDLDPRALDFYSPELSYIDDFMAGIPAPTSPGIISNDTQGNTSQDKGKFGTPKFIFPETSEPSTPYVAGKPDTPVLNFDIPGSPKSNSFYTDISGTPKLEISRPGGTPKLDSSYLDTPGTPKPCAATPNTPERNTFYSDVPGTPTSCVDIPDPPKSCTPYAGTPSTLDRTSKPNTPGTPSYDHLLQGGITCSETLKTKCEVVLDKESLQEERTTEKGEGELNQEEQEEEIVAMQGFEGERQWVEVIEQSGGLQELEDGEISDSTVEDDLSLDGNSFVCLEDLTNHLDMSTESVLESSRVGQWEGTTDGIHSHGRKRTRSRSPVHTAHKDVHKRLGVRTRDCARERRDEHRQRRRSTDRHRSRPSHHRSRSPHSRRTPHHHRTEHHRHHSGRSHHRTRTGF